MYTIFLVNCILLGRDVIGDKQEKLSTQILSAVFFGIFVNLAAVVILGYVLFIKEYGDQGPPKLFNELLMKPDVFFFCFVSW
jgi:hypothetical protein